MCGIFGIVPGRRSGLDESRVRFALGCLASRGPDDEGWYADDDVFFGHRRLSVIDVSPGGHQPMASDDGSVLLTDNGEIYRFDRLRRELEQLGHRFRSTSDSEVLLRGYEQWGKGVLERIDGMFAFAIWDAKTKSLLLARDRLGKKPLFWARRGDVLGFSSLLRPLVEAGVVRPEIDPVALGQYLHFNYVPGPRTIFRDAELLPAGTWLEFRDGHIETGRYWDLKNVAPEAGGADPQRRFKSLLLDSVRARLVSDVPLGVFLSGGVDSALVAALAQRESSGARSTFSVGFREASYDEREKARRVATRIGADHHDIECTAGDVPDLLPRIVASADHLLADQSMIPLTKLAGYAKQSVTVVLTGDGGDELLAGYPTYRALDYASTYISMVPQPLREVLSSASRHLPAQAGKMATVTLLQRFLHATTSDLQRAHAGWRTIWTQDEISSIVRARRSDPRAPKELFVDAPWADYARQMAPHGGWNVLQRAVHADIAVWLVDSILGKVDRATMSHGLEARSPLLDSKLVEYSFATLLADPARNAGKQPIRRMARELLGDELAATAKAPFQTPFADWFAGPLRGLVRDSIATLETNLAGVFDIGRMRAIEEEHAARRHNHDFKLWGLATLAEWSKLYPGLSIAESAPDAKAAR